MTDKTLEYKQQIVAAFKKYQIEIDIRNFSDLRPDLIQDIASAVEELESAIKNEEFGDMDCLALMGFTHSTYNGQVYNEVMSVIKEIYNGGFNSDIAKTTGLSETHVELIQYTLCGRELADYGTSPRGCWLTPLGQAIWEMIEVYTNIEAANQTKEDE